MLPFRRTACLVFLLLLFCVAGPAAQNPPAPAGELAVKILAATGAHPSLHMTFKNKSSLGVVDAAALRRAIEQDLRSGGAHLGSGAQASIPVRVTLSESWRNRLLVAEIQLPAGKRVVMVELPRSASAPGAAAHSRPVIALTRRIVWRQSAPFLSFLEWEPSVDHSSYLMVLEAGSLALYRRDQGRWQWQAAASIPHTGPWPRDPRGWLWIEPIVNVIGGVIPPEWLHVALPGVTCTMPLVAAGGQSPLAFVSGTLSLTCTPAPAAGTVFPIFDGREIAATATLAPGRNFFSAAIQRDGAAEQLSPFFSATIVPDDQNRPLLVAAATDGKTYVYDDSGQSEGAIPAWGSDIAGIESLCGGGWQVLATRAADWTQKDAVAAYEIVDGKAVSVGEPIDLPGPVTALETAPDGVNARAVVLDRNSGLYDAYTISLSCGH